VGSDDAREVVMRTVTSLLVVCVFISTLSPFVDLSAQEPAGIERGARVRVTAPGCLRIMQQEARFEVLRGDTLVVVTDSVARCPLTYVTRLDVHRGRGVSETRLAAMSFGGLALGAGIGWVIGKVIDASESEGGLQLHLAPGYGAAIGAPIGWVVGTVAGLLIKTDKWENVPLDRLRLQPVATPDGRFGLAASVRF